MMFSRCLSYLHFGNRNPRFFFLIKQKELPVNVQITLNMLGVIFIVKQKKEQAESIPDFNYVYNYPIWQFFGGNQIKNPYKFLWLFFWVILSLDDSMSFAWVGGQRCRAWSVGLGDLQIEGRFGMGGRHSNGISSIGDVKTSIKMGYIHKSMIFDDDI